MRPVFLPVFAMPENAFDLVDHSVSIDHHTRNPFQYLVKFFFPPFSRVTSRGEATKIDEYVSDELVEDKIFYTIRLIV